MSTFQIVQLAAGDEAHLTRALRTLRGTSGDNHAAFLADNSTLALLALQADDEVLGWAWGLRQRHALGHTQVQLYEVAVVLHARRRGIGRALVCRFRDIVRSEGHAKLWLFTDELNAAARSLYESVGGSPSGHTHATYWWHL